jgi:ABC-type uncharacterized transport system ATPase subunit
MHSCTTFIGPNGAGKSTTIKFIHQGHIVFSRLKYEILEQYAIVRGATGSFNF